MDNTLAALLGSERLTKDVDNLMNSLFWVESLKNKSAKGISDKLNNQLNESQKFMKNFIKYTINLKRIQFRNVLVSQNNDKKKQTQIERQLNLEQIIQNVCTSRSDNNLLDFFLNKLPRENIQEFHIVLSSQFIVECSFLAILDLEDCIGTVNEIQNKINEWFPELRASSTKIKVQLEAILNGNYCFKRLVNFTKSASQNEKPIILGKRQYVWSINQNFLKPFVRYFYKLFNKKVGAIVNLSDESSLFEKTESFVSLEFSLPVETAQAINKLSLNSKLFNSTNSRNLATVISVNDFNMLFNSWKHKLEQFKLFMQIKHSNFGFAWNDSILHKKNECLKHLNSVKYGIPSKAKQIVKRLKSSSKQSKHLENNVDQHLLVVKKKPNDSLFSDQLNFQSQTIIQPEYEISQETFMHNIGETVTTATVEMNQEYKAGRSHQLHLKFDDKECLENLLSSEDLLKLEESKSMSSMVSDSMMCNNVINIGNCMNSNYFNILPVSPSICNSFFNHQEINVAHILSTSSADSGVEELFCDELKLDGDISIHL